MLGSLLFLLVPVIVYFDAGSLQSRDSVLYRRAMGLSPERPTSDEEVPGGWWP